MGPVAIYDTSYHSYFDVREVKKERLDLLLPYSKYGTQLTVPFSFLAKDTPQAITVEFAGTRVFAPINKSQILATQLIMLFVAIGVTIVAIYLRLKRISPVSLVMNIKNRIIGVLANKWYVFKIKILKRQKNTF